MTPAADVLQAYAVDALELLMLNVQLYRQGVHPAYRVAALQLRLLLCDTTHRHNELVNMALAPRLKPALRLPPLDERFLSLAEFPPASPVLNPSLPPLPLDAWLAQPVVISSEKQLTVRQWIRAVCDQDGGAHVDLRAAGGEVRGVWPVEKLIRLAEALIPELKRQLSGGGPASSAPPRRMQDERL